MGTIKRRSVIGLWLGAAVTYAAVLYLARGQECLNVSIWSRVMGRPLSEVGFLEVTVLEQEAEVPQTVVSATSYRTFVRRTYLRDI